MAIKEIAPDLFRISTYVPELNLQFKQFLIRDDEPLLFHTAMRGLFPSVRLAALAPKTLAIMHGSTSTGDGKQAIGDLAAAMDEVLAT